MKINLILLAAGDSRRFGSNKLLHEFRGKPMYRHVVDEIAKMRRDVFEKKIVVSQYDEILDDLTEEGYLVVRNAESKLGISHSIQLGIEAAEGEAWCFLVGDQPHLRAETIEKFVEAFQKSGKDCACVQCGGKTGNPCIFSERYREALLKLSGDIGGKSIIREHMDTVFFYEVKEARELEDMDVPVKKEETDCII